MRYRIGTKQFAKSGFRTRKEADIYLQDQLRRIRSGSWTDPSSAQVTIQSVFEDWIQAKQISARTRYDYEETWRTVIAPSWGAVRLRDVSPSSISRWISEAMKTHSVARMQKTLTIFSQVFDWAVADQRIPENPIKRARSLSTGSLLGRQKSSRKKMLLNHQQVFALAAETGSHYQLMILVMAYTGLRFGEVVALQSGDIDLSTMRIHVVRAFSDVGGVLVEVPPKSGKAREVPIPSFLHSSIATRLSDLVGDHALVFTTTSGSTIRYSRWLKDVFRPAASRAGLIGLTPHALRHTFAALAIQAGANPKVLQVAMGHSDIRLTLDTYGGLYGDDLDLLAERLDTASKALKAAPAALVG